MKTPFLATIMIIMTFGAISVLHNFGYKIYGYPTMYRCPPPKDEGWLKVTSYEKDTFTVEDGQKISIYPFYLKEEALALSANELSKRFFNLPFDDLYARKESEKWIVRFGDSYVTASQSFFPKRRYGYFDSNFREAIDFSEIAYSKHLRITGYVSEEEVLRFYKEK